MAFRRITAPPGTPSPDALAAAMAGVGMNVAAAADGSANVEDTLLHASRAGMEEGDLRSLGLVAAWMGTHASLVNAGRLHRVLRKHPSDRVRAFWSAVGRWLGKDPRLARFTALYRGKRVDLLTAGSDFQVGRRGEDPRFEGTALRVPAKVLRHRPADILSEMELLRRHAACRWRLVIGPTYRADMWAALERDPGLPAATLARLTYGSFATAWQVLRDHRQWSAAMAAPLWPPLDLPIAAEGE